MRKLEVNQFKLEVNKFLADLEKLEDEISGLGIDLAEEKKLKKLAKLICSEPVYEKIFLEHFADNN